MAKQVNDEVVKKNISLTGKIMNYLLDHPSIFASLPNEFELVILPENDPDMRIYNLSLLDKFGSEGKDIVFARISEDVKEIKPSFFAPVAI